MNQQESLLPVERHEEGQEPAESRLPVVLTFPEDRPIIGRDLDAFKDYFGATVAQALAALGIQTHGRWSTIVKKKCRYAGGWRHRQSGALVCRASGAFSVRSGRHAHAQA
ncbi:hypothetical protein [Chromobacterium sphagni]|uniref:hypothetical protein n=1 Tax=Chromobacterium sphagni TaxID=1903179 RepID=UPI0011144B73|nr:hypothetical protein [Chromobacterium sphagni]